MNQSGKEPWPVDGMTWMYTSSLFLAWIPGLGGFLAGFLGGMLVRSVKRAILAAVLSAACFGPALYMLVPVSIPIHGWYVPVWFLYLVGLLTGAVLGGLLGGLTETAASWLRRSRSKA